ncbi:hypothetical protein [Novipirellula caenicola]|uniref:Uncharacterized protein n=1 Tax=Novipirellula caenicola TaxID=1536901 RepID=A0ABP9W1G3_9BACT
MKLPTTLFAFVVASLTSTSVFAQQSEKTTEDRIAILQNRVRELEALVAKLTLEKQAAEQPANIVRYAKFKELQADGAIVRIFPADGMTRESVLPMDIAFFPIPTTHGIRLGQTVFSVDDAESQLLKWKKIANDNGVKNVQLWVVTDDMQNPISQRLLTFGVTNFHAAGGENLKRYKKRWAETMKAFE